MITEGLRGADRTRAGVPNGVVQHRGAGDLSHIETLQDTLWPKAELEAETAWGYLGVRTHQEPWAKAGSQGWSSGQVNQLYLPMHRGRPPGGGAGLGGRREPRLPGEAWRALHSPPDARGAHRKRYKRLLRPMGSCARTSY